MTACSHRLQRALVDVGGDVDAAGQPRKAEGTVQFRRQIDQDEPRADNIRSLFYL